MNMVLYKLTEQIIINMQEGKNMKNIINNKLLILTAVSGIVMSGCVAKTITVNDTTVKKTASKLPWKKTIQKNSAMSKANFSNSKFKTKISKKEDCVDCYASVPTVKKENIAVVERPSSTPETKYSFDYSKAPSENEIEENYYAYNEPKVASEDFSENTYTYDAKPSIESYSSKTVIQIGAFRKYAGAKVYAKKYDLLSRKYNVDIKKSVKDSSPLYRVRIEGFSNKSEAKEFISRYGITGAFLVRN